MTGIAEPSVLYVGGWGRSGSTVAGMLLGRLDDHVNAGEVRELFRRGVLENRLCGCGSPFRQCAFWTQVGEKAFGGWNQEVAERIWADLRVVDRGWTTPLLVLRMGSRRFRGAQARLRSPIQSLYSAITEVAGSGIVVDTSKSPNYAALLESLGIQVGVMHLVRDPRAVMYSWKKQVTRGDSTTVAAQGDSMVRYSALSGSLRYGFYNTVTQLLPRNRFEYARIKYEELAKNPSGFLEGVAARSSAHADGAPPEWLRGNVASVGINHTVDGNPARLGGEDITLVVDEEWRQKQTRAELMLITSLTLPWVIAYGYGRRNRDS